MGSRNLRRRDRLLGTVALQCASALMFLPGLLLLIAIAPDFERFANDVSASWWLGLSAAYAVYLCPVGAVFAALAACLRVAWPLSVLLGLLNLSVSASYLLLLPT